MSEVINHDQIMSIVDDLLEDEVDIPRFIIERTLINFKKNIISRHRQDAHSYKIEDFSNGLDWAVEIVGQVYFNISSWNAHEETLLSPDQVNDLPFNDLPEYQLFRRTRVFEQWDTFKQIVLGYRTFHNEDIVQQFSKNFERNLFGSNVIYLLRWSLNRFLIHYGHQHLDPQTGKPLGLVANATEIFNLINDYKDIMDHFLKSFHENPMTFSAEILTGADLFQFMSDGNELANLDEITAYISNIVQTTLISEDLITTLSTYCEWTNNDLGRPAIETTCFREYFVTALLDDLNLQDSLPLLSNFVQSSTPEQVKDYLLYLEKSSKEVTDPLIPMAKIDIGRLLSVVLSVETTMMRHDKNDDGIFDFNEAEVGYPVFRQTLTNFAKLPSSMDPLVKSVFIYILKKMEIPSTAKLLWFHTFGKKKDLRASRINLGAVFAAVSESLKEALKRLTQACIQVDKIFENNFLRVQVFHSLKVDHQRYSMKLNYLPPHKASDKYHSHCT